MPSYHSPFPLFLSFSIFLFATKRPLKCSYTGSLDERCIPNHPGSSTVVVVDGIESLSQCVCGASVVIKPKRLAGLVTSSGSAELIATFYSFIYFYIFTLYVLFVIPSLTLLAYRPKCFGEIKKASLIKY